MKPIAKPGENAATDPAATPGHGATPGLAAAIDLLWVRFLPDIRNRVALLEAAAAACAANQLSDAQREAAHAAAHKLAGTLGTFNLNRGTELAREFELLCARDENPDPALAGRLAQIAAELRAIVDSRK
jgi:HPt (histidine-containing phosphotransfer) domain-containing protein